MYIKISKAVRLDSDVCIYVTRLLCGLSDFVRFSIITSYTLYIYIRYVCVCVYALPNSYFWSVVNYYMNSKQCNFVSYYSCFFVYNVFFWIQIGLRELFITMYIQIYIYILVLKLCVGFYYFIFKGGGG